MNKTALNSQKEKHFMLSLRRATPALLPITVSISQFLSTISLRRATVPWPTVSPPTPNFYPRSPCGERRQKQPTQTAQKPFLSTLSLRRATSSAGRESDTEDYFYPRSPCGERRPVSDAGNCTATHFYPRSPCGERRMRIDTGNNFGGFLSTLSLRRATLVQIIISGYARDFYPRSPCGERLFDTMQIVIVVVFLSTLSLRRATGTLRTVSVRKTFLSTLSLRRATRLPTALRTPHHKFLSTLSLRRATKFSVSGSGHISYFYPRSPCGERLCVNEIPYQRKIFLSTLSLRRATPQNEIIAYDNGFLSTLSLRRATFMIHPV